MSDLNQPSAWHRSKALRRGAAASLLLCALLSVSACSSPDPAGQETSSEVEADGGVDAGDPQTKQARQASGTLKRLLDLSGKVYNSAYRNNWQKSASQFNRLQDLGDRLDNLVASGAVDGLDVEALLLQIDTLEDAIVSEQQIPAMVAANNLAETGLTAAQTLDPEGDFLDLAQFAYYGRQLEIVTFGLEGDAGTDIDPDETETLKQAADQVVQAWDTLDTPEASSTETPSLETDTPAAATAPSGGASSEQPEGEVDTVTGVGTAVNQLRYAPNENYAALARRIVLGSQKMLAEQPK